MQKMKKFIPIFLWGLSLVFLVTGNSMAADTANVSTTVTVQNVSVSASDGSISYGTLSTNSTANTVTLSDTQTITNDGNVTSTINVRGANTTAWTLASSAGADQYIHRWCKATCGSPPTNYTALTTSYATLQAAVSAAGTVSLDLQITTPTSSSSYTQQTATVTVQAVAD